MPRWRSRRARWIPGGGERDGEGDAHLGADKQAEVPGLVHKGVVEQHPAASSRFYALVLDARPTKMSEGDHIEYFPLFVALGDQSVPEPYVQLLMALYGNQKAMGFIIQTS